MESEIITTMSTKPTLDAASPAASGTPRNPFAPKRQRVDSASSAGTNASADGGVSDAVNVSDDTSDEPVILGHVAAQKPVPVRAANSNLPLRGVAAAARAGGVWRAVWESIDMISCWLRTFKRADGTVEAWGCKFCPSLRSQQFRLDKLKLHVSTRNHLDAVKAALLHAPPCERLVRFCVPLRCFRASRCLTGCAVERRKPSLTN